MSRQLVQKLWSYCNMGSFASARSGLAGLLGKDGDELEMVVTADLQRTFTGTLLTADDADITDEK